MDKKLGQKRPTENDLSLRHYSKLKILTVSSSVEKHVKHDITFVFIPNTLGSKKAFPLCYVKALMVASVVQLVLLSLYV